MPDLPIPGDREFEQTPLARLVFRGEIRHEAARSEQADTARAVPADRPTRNPVAGNPPQDKVRENWEINAMGYESEQQLSLRIEDATYAFFGPRVRSDVTIAPGGSIEISLLVIALGAINTYRHHIDNIEWFASHVKSIIKRFLPPPPRGYRVLVAEQQISVPTLPEPQPTAAAPSSASSSTPPPQPRADQAQRFLLILAEEMAILVGLAIALLAIYATR